MSVHRSLSLSLSGILMLVVMQAVRADVTQSAVTMPTATTYTMSSTAAATLTSPYTSISSFTVNAAGEILLYELGTASYYEAVAQAAGQPVVFAGSTSPTNTKLSGTTTVYETYSTLINGSGATLGSAYRTFGESTSDYTSYGSDLVLSVPTTANGNTYSTTTINNQGIFGATNTSGTLNGTVYYYYLLTPLNEGTHPYVSTTPTGLNSSDQVIGSIARVTGTTMNTGLGSDAFLYTPGTGGGTGMVTLLGLGASNPGLPYSYSKVVTSTDGTQSATYSVTSSTAKAINDSGWVIGTTSRYVQAYVGTTPSTVLGVGTDSYLYTPTGGSQEIGLTGSTAATLGGYYSVAYTYNNTSTGVVGSGTYQNSAVAGISSSGYVAGTVSVYPVASYIGTSTPSNAPSQEAWLYKPSPTIGTASGYGTSGAGIYVQLGLVSAGTASTAVTPVIGYLGTGNFRSSSVSFVAANGTVTGTSNRFYTDSSTAHGVDTWFYNGTSTVTITPTAPSASLYVTNGGYSSSSITLMNASGMVAGIQSRVSAAVSTSGTSTGAPASNYGVDAWVYNPATTTTTVIASPALLAGDPDFAAYKAYFTATEDFVAAIDGISDTGFVVGHFSAYEGATTSSTLIGEYLFEWSPTTGTEILGSVNTTDLVDPLASGGTFSSLINGFSGPSLKVDAAGNVYGLGMSGGNPAIYEFVVPAAVPEPASIGVLALGGIALLRRRQA